VQVVLLSLSVMSSVVTSRRSRLNGLTNPRRSWALTASKGGILGHGVAPVSLSVSLPHLHVTFLLKKSIVSKLEQKVVRFYMQST
jgi:hypothetical protein